MTQRERQERSRREIMEAAMEEFGTKEYNKVTMEGICTGHGISKGMMYHYYANKDELFLLCVEETFRALKAHLERDAQALEGQGAFESIKNYFMLREHFFQLHPKQKQIFESAMLRTPQHLVGQIEELRKPIRDMNRLFLEQAVGRMLLRPGVSREKAVQYLEGMEYLFRSSIQSRAYPGVTDLHTMLEMLQELLDMALYGIVDQTAAS